MFGSGYFMDYFVFWIAILICFALSAAASAAVHGTFKKYSAVRNRSGMTGRDTVERLLRANGVTGIRVGKTGGTLSDHYHPKKGEVNLSEDTYASASVAAAAVAAHEIGHVMQKTEGALFYRIRTALVPVVNFGSFLSMPMVLLGVVLDIYVTTANPNTGFYVAMIGVALYGSAFLFSLITLPVELDASRRAKKMLLAEGILTEREIGGAGRVLSAAAMTYLASLLTSLVYFLRFLFYVLSIFGRSRD